ncbi:ERF family protein [Ornithinibacillus xuwenensis]|uniref:ERF family protein n=1 Tax=Ornithinibacillus xuwenensis TaxID=3144668 RepID=A0ABU9XBU7_9BACI
MSEPTFYERVNNLQSELVAPKSNYNSFGKYKYRSAEDILEAVKPLNKKHNVFLSIGDEPILIGDWHYIKATAKLIDALDPSNQIEVTAYARESQQKKGMDDSQITGTASSYARKYALNGLYLIDDTKDADTDEYKKQGQETPEEPNLNNQITMLVGEALPFFKGDRAKLSEAIGKSQDELSKLFQSNNNKAKKTIIQKLEGIINDYKQAG